MGADPKIEPLVTGDGGADLGCFHSNSKPLHRVQDIRRSQGISVKAVAQAFNLSPSEVREQEASTTNLTIAQLYAWASVLEVPAAKLLVGDSLGLSPEHRANLLRLVENVQRLQESAGAGIRPLVDNMADTLFNMMIDLGEIQTGPPPGRRRISAQSLSAEPGLCHFEGQWLHRIREVRIAQGFSSKRAAKVLDISVPEVKVQEKCTTNLTLTQVYAWASMLGVPVIELLGGEPRGLSPEIQQRAQLVRLMKTVRSLQENMGGSKARPLVDNLKDILLEIMPELEDVQAWPSVGQRRTRDEESATERRIVRCRELL